MKLAKTLAMMFALVVAVFCFSAPLVSAGDEHPWDEEGPSSGGINSIDPNGDIGDGTQPTDGLNTRISASTIYHDAVILLQYTILYHELPNSGNVETESEAENPGVTGANE